MALLSLMGLDQSGSNNRVKLDPANAQVSVGNPVKLDKQNGGNEVVINAADMERPSQASREGRVFSAATPIVQVNSERFLNVSFTNPADSGKLIIFAARKIQGNRPEGERPMQYGFIINPDMPLDATPFPGNNHLTGQPQSSMLCAYSVDTQRLDSDPSTQNPAGGYLPNGGHLLNIDDNRDEDRIVPPGNSFGFFVGGLGYTDVADAARVVFTWIEEEIA